MRRRLWHALFGHPYVQVTKELHDKYTMTHVGCNCGFAYCGWSIETRDFRESAVFESEAPR